MSVSASRICEAVKISQLYQYLTGTQPKRGCGDRYRGPATWRSGDNPSAVSMDDSRGIWHDFVTDQGGGILDFVIAVKGGTRQEALQVVASFAGIQLESEPFSTEEHRDWLEHKRTLQTELALAQYWQRGAIKMTKELLDELKAPLQNPELPSPEISEIYETTQLLRRLQQLIGLDLIEEYHVFLELQPGYTSALVRWAKEREQQERRAMLRYLGLR